MTDRGIHTRAVGALFLFITSVLPGTALADRHCSYARESAFYTREISAEALKAPTGGCQAIMEKALKRLRTTQEELAICSCAPAQGPLKQWFDNRPSGGLDPNASCIDNARAINAAAKTVLKEVEKCF
jgi:hypothetical protein